MTDLFTELTKTVIGAEQLQAMRNRVLDGVKYTNAFPFYNIKRVGSNLIKIEMALAGYTISNLDITVEKDVLTISSTGADVEKLTDYMFRGFASRKFSRQFSLMDNIKVRSADLSNGILNVWLETIVKDENKPQKIHIDSPSASLHPQILNEDSSI